MQPSKSARLLIMKSTKEWLSISDMMTGLMMIFLFIAILYMNQLEKKVKEVDKVAQEYAVDIKTIREALEKEFQEDLKRWNAEIGKNSLVIRFLSPDVMFNPMESIIKPKFKNILNNFCPRYFKLLHNNFKSSIEEIRIDGHTSKEWQGLPIKQAYFRNMELSQDRTRAVLHYCVTVGGDKKDIGDWAIKKLTANGLSSSRPHPKCLHDTVKCRKLNRRVEFRVQLSESSILHEIIKQLKNVFSSKVTTL